MLRLSDKHWCPTASGFITVERYVRLTCWIFFRVTCVATFEGQFEDAVVIIQITMHFPSDEVTFGRCFLADSNRLSTFTLQTVFAAYLWSNEFSVSVKAKDGSLIHVLGSVLQDFFVAIFYQKLFKTDNRLDKQFCLIHISSAHKYELNSSFLP